MNFFLRALDAAPVQELSGLRQSSRSPFSFNPGRVLYPLLSHRPDVASTVVPSPWSKTRKEVVKIISRCGLRSPCLLGGRRTIKKKPFPSVGWNGWMSGDQGVSGPAGRWRLLCGSKIEDSSQLKRWQGRPQKPK